MKIRKSPKHRLNMVLAMKHRDLDKRGGLKKPDDGLDRSDSTGLAKLLDGFLSYLETHNFSEITIKTRRVSLIRFLQWCQERDLNKPEEVSRPILESYQRHLFRFKKPDGNPLGISTQVDHLVAIKMFFKWICRNNRFLNNPSSELEMPREEKRLPQCPLSLSEVETVLSVPNLNEPLGLRDRAIMETFYSTAIRRAELCKLDPSDLMADRGLLNIRQGKGKKDRIVPIGKRALTWIKKYLEQARPKLEMNSDHRFLFLSAYGGVISPSHLSGVIARYMEAANLGRKASCHIFRHSAATHMLENGADIRYIQQLLGHANLDTTSIYTQVSVHQLQKVHALTHPAEKTVD